MHRVKIMTDQELRRFKLFSVSKIVFNSLGRTAIFISATARPEKLILICGLHVRYLENLSPGGWVDCSNANDHCWHLLAGTSSSFDNFSIAKDVVDNGRVTVAASNVYYMNHVYLNGQERDQRSLDRHDYSH